MVNAQPPADHSRITNHTLVPTAGIYTLDPVHTFVEFSAQHLVVGRVRGRFERLSGTVTIADEPTASTLDVDIDAASLTTLLAMRDDDLRSAGFLDVVNFPRITYRSTQVAARPTGEWNVLGDLTVRGITLPVLLVVRFGGSITDSSGNARAAFHASGSLTRSAFGVAAELAEEAGTLSVDDDVTLSIDAEAIRPL